MKSNKSGFIIKYPSDKASADPFDHSVVVGYRKMRGGEIIETFVVFPEWKVKALIEELEKLEKVKKS